MVLGWCGDVALEAADRLAFGLALGDPSSDVVLGAMGGWAIHLIVAGPEAAADGIADLWCGDEQPTTTATSAQFAQRRTTPAER
jgi:hypothetical protein